jgi:nitrogen fixation protein
MMKRFCFLTILLFFISGCAGVRIVKITHDNPYEEGIRFYAPHPYLWVTKDTSGNLQASIVWLPNKNEEYVIKVKSGIGSVDTKFTLENGWNLTQFGETRDSKTPELITALTGSLKGITEIFEKAEKEELRAGLYMFIFDDKTGLVSDIEPVMQFK